MRFPTKAGIIDKDLAHKQMYRAYQLGVNYYDTAYLYHGGQSEGVLGDFIKKCNLEGKVCVADKLPAFLVSKPEHIEKYFNTQLERLGLGKIDFYLMHSLGSFNAWKRLKSFGIEDFIAEKKASGQIGHIGFSFHGRLEDFIEILEDYDWDFCQIQFNYLDENYQAGLSGLKRAAELGIGVVVMEPLRGGSLAAKAPDKVNDIFSKTPAGDGLIHSSAYWGLRWVMNHPEVSVVLSGMNDYKHIEENAGVASQSSSGTMTDAEIQVIEEVKKVYHRLMKVPCTACNYCMLCPFGVDIPATFSNYNSKYFFGGNLTLMVQYAGRCTGFIGKKKSGANLCKNCGKCKTKCPQSIDIPVKLREAHKALSNPLLTLGLNIISLFKGRKG